jgi:hypothetical protein
MYKPRTDNKYRRTQHLGYYNKLMNNTLSEEDYVRSHTDDKEKYWYEIPEIKKDYEKYRLYLLRLSVSSRRIALLNSASTGMTWKDIFNSFDIHSPKLTSFIQNKAKRGYDSQLLACLALLCRIPVSWLLEEEPTNEWDIGFVSFILDRIKSRDELISILQEQQNRKHVVKCADLNIRGITLKLRVEILPEGFIIEVFNNMIMGNELAILKEILEIFNCK